MTGLEDPVPLAQALIRCESVTPQDAGAQRALEKALKRLGFACQHLTFEKAGTTPVPNLYARLGDGSPGLGFAGHTDIVPAGDRTAWRVDPFAGEVIDGVLYGRGAVDMKGAIACFVAATARLLAAGGPPRGSISLLITGDEEGPAINGTRKLLRWLEKTGSRLDACLVGEPTNPTRVGEMIKIGRRGSLTATLRVPGRQGHTAYHEQADNPIPRLLAMLTRLDGATLDGGSNYFAPSHLEITSVDVGNTASNVIPGEARAVLNVRFNDHYDCASLEAWLRAQLDSIGGAYELEIACAGEAFITEPGPFTELLETVIERELDLVPELSTSGGTSDARFIKDHCPTVEFGLVSETIHAVDERIALSELEALTRVYHKLLESYVRPA